MFVDKVTVEVQAGSGGNGAVSFRHEKFVDRGGPDGGDGGNGGDIILLATRNQNTLAAFRYQKLLQAEPGQPGGKRRKHGKSGKNLVVAVPVGTVAASEEGQILADLLADGQEAVIAKGGKGGFGNAHFASSRRQAPRVAEKGERGEHSQVILELKMIADIGLVGLPNAGKSTLLAAISNARPEIADYPFTTLRPNLGMVDVDKTTSLLFADIPGLIAGASQGKGLGDDFLRHVERTSALVHLIDVYGDVADAYETIQNELKAYKINLASRPQLVVLNKIDGADQKLVKDKLSQLKKSVPKGTQLFAISAQSGAGLKDLLYAAKKMRARQQKQEQKASPAEEQLPVISLPETGGSWRVVRGKNGYTVSGRKIERFAERTDFSNPAGVQRLKDIMRKMGIAHELRRKGIEPGQSITVGDHTFTW